MKKLIAILLSAMFIIGAMSVTVNATDSFETPHIEFIFEDGTSLEIQNRIIADLTGENDGAAAYGLTCTLFGHKLDTGTTSAITHNASSTAPRCLQKTYSYEICTRCDYSEYTLLSSKYIYCC
ncbi:MAG: hypothetical protein IKU08_06600 [Clostridia bacterium]|nr:hypothetical protein [Clostridia bacterium]